MPKYDVVIIGSGLGGLLCGYTLSKEGYNVCILEKNKIIGGCLQTFKRKNCVFDTGVHYVGSLDEGQVMHQYFKYYNLIGKLNIKRLDDNAFDIISIGNEDYPHALGHQNFIERLTEKFPSERVAITGYVEKMQSIGNYFPFQTLNESIDTTDLQLSMFSDGAYDYFEKLTNNRRLRDVLTGSAMLYAGIKEKTPFLIHALIMNSYIESSYRFIGGASQIAYHIAESIKAKGGSIFTNSEVTTLSANATEMEYAILSNGEKIEANQFISNVHPSTTLGMIEGSRAGKAFKTRIDALDDTIGFFTLYIVLKPETFKFINSNIYYLKEQNVWEAADYKENNWPTYYLFYTNPAPTSPEYAESIEVMAYMKFSEVKQWENTFVENRGQDYIDFKQRKAEQLLHCVEIKYPGLREKINTYYTSTPLTFRDYTGTRNGSVYGILRDHNNPNMTYIPPKTRISNLFLTGQNTNQHGVLGVAIGSMLTCSYFLDKNYLITKIKKA